MKPENDAHRVVTLRGAARDFFHRRGPRLIATTVATAWLRRARLGRPRAAELPVMAGVLAWWPLQEWLAHKHLLHMRPLEGGGIKLDPEFARAHRAHHQTPRDIGLVLLPTSVLAAAIPASHFLWKRLFSDARLAATAEATYASAALAYEWTHYLVHTGYKPQSARFGRIRRNHRNHHHYSEHYWLGFTVPEVDAWLGTEPRPKDVARSPTVKNIHPDL